MVNSMLVLVALMSSGHRLQMCFYEIMRQTLTASLNSCTASVNETYLSYALFIVNIILFDLLVGQLTKPAVSGVKTLATNMMTVNKAGGMQVGCP